ncbi:single-stranded-DNA-specific exonuclease RecJ [Hydrogenimonas urashimensis]|uniref:single-stranded-DNA-specific exonuclease RecJ n=1 Tax=Hydrogenimonas urashimensis TaxID=2740515 RepID=UPI001916998D|nr:single-stranded-DNA-specific exonuclease RecJ [Hydrogenimonas urashimensis]
MSKLPRLTKAKVEALLAARFEDGIKELRDLPDPFALHDMDRAADRIVSAIRGNERIAVVGDYDVDGVVSSALMAEFFQIIDYPVEILIPNRFTDGYGVSAEILDRLDADVVITVDNGIAAIEAAEVCRARGIDLIITDHHTPSDTLPNAYAIVNPKKESCSFAYPEICGAQVAWFLIGALKQRLGLAIKMGRFLDLLALAIVADVMPLTSINRPLVRKGLAMLSTSSRPAFVAVRSYLGKQNFSAEDIGYGIAPRINSAGRMEDASIALRFLRASTLEEASREWLALDSLNRMRRQEEARMTEAAVAMANPDDSVIVVAQEGWHEGIVGIVASRLVDRFKKPAIVLSVENGRAKGSGRSIGEVDLFALLKRSSDYLTGFGGHPLAAGLALDADNLEAFRAAVCEEASKLDPALFTPKEHLLGELPMGEIDWELMEILQRYEPYGEANQRPRFLLSNVEVAEAKSVGAEKKHLKLFLKDGDIGLHAIQFGYVKPVKPGDRITLSGTLQINEFNNKKSIQMMVYQIY